MNDEHKKAPHPCLVAALDYAARGWEVFPSPQGTKKSHKAMLFSNGQPWGKTTETKEIRKDWMRWPNANVCIATGPASDFFVIEADTLDGHSADGLATLALLEEKYGKLPPTLMAVSPSGSVHRYYEWPDNGRVVKNSAGDLGAGVDVRGSGGMVVAPPSVKPDKGAYKWLNDLPIAALSPSWLAIEELYDNLPEAKATGDDPEAEPSRLIAALDIIKNPELGWEAWNRLGMAAWFASSGDLNVYKAFDRLSQKSKKYNPVIVKQRWYEAYPSKPPDRLGAGTIFYEADKADPDWRARYEATKPKKFKKKNGVIVNSRGNILYALEKLGVSVQHNAFEDRSLITGLDSFDFLDDRAMDRLWLTIDEKFKFRPSKDFFWTVVFDEARRNSFHPVCDYLDGLVWDGVKRIGNWLTTYAKVKETPYTRAVGELMLIAAVRRVRSPGCKFDEMPVLQSEQGFDKSTALSELAVKPEWFTDDLPLNSDSKTMMERLKGRWIIEAAELKGMRHGDVEHLKAFLSRSVDRARMSYDRTTSELKRQSIIVGTTNHEKFLRDQTGNRRFWPIRGVAFDLEKLRADRDQLWAEAATREAEGASIRLPKKLWADAGKEQSAHLIEEPWVELIRNHLDGKVGKLLSVDAWKLVRVSEGQRTQNHNERLGMAMRESGWERVKMRFEDPIGMHWGYRPDKIEKGTMLPRIEVDYYYQTDTLTVSVGESKTVSVGKNEKKDVGDDIPF